MKGELFQHTKYLSVLVLLFFSVTFIFPQAFAGVPPAIVTDVTIDSINAFQASIEIFCTDPTLSGGASITGNVLDIDDSILFDSIDITKSNELFCDSFTPNSINTASLTDRTTYYVRLTVSTDVPADSIDTDSFVQPFAGKLVLNDRPPGSYEINFRDILVTDGIEPSINIPDLFSFESGTLTVTDHNANIDLTKKEIITIQINGVDVNLEETGDNTGIFTFTVNAGDSVSYDPGTLGLARATINLEFDADLEGGSSLVPFASDEMHEDIVGPIPGAFDPREVIYRDANGDGTVSVGDPDEIAAFSLVGFTVNEMHEDSGANPTAFDVGETVYDDADASLDVSAGDIRLANAVTQGFSDGSVVDAAAFDFDIGFPLVSFTGNEMHEDVLTLNGLFDTGETVYDDADASLDVSAGDIRLANAATQGFSDGSVVVTSDIRLANAFSTFGFPDGSVVDAAAFDFDIGFPLVPFTSEEKHEDSGLTLDVFDVAETVYNDADLTDDVSLGDTRLANIPIQGYVDGSVVAADAFDGNGDIIIEDLILNSDQLGGSEGFTPVDHAVSITFANGGQVVTGENIDVTMSYADFVPNDALLLQMYYQGPGLAYGQITAKGSVDPASHDTDAKTVDSNPTFDTGGGIPVYNDGTGMPLPTKQGNYVLGFDLGSGGGGSGAIGKSGFVVNAIGIVKTLVGGGGGGNSPPSFGQSSFAIISGGEEGFGGILSDNDAKTFEQTKTFKVGEKAVIRIDFTEGGGIGKIEHIKLFTNVRDGQKRQDSDASISYDPLKSPQVTVHDPNGLFSEANFELLQKDAANFVLKYDLTFAKPMAKSDLILESWNLKKWSTINKIPNAIEVISSGIVQETASEPVETFLEDVTDDQVIPVWVKSNAKWWSDDKIDNDNFISGLEYLVNEGIIKVSLPEGTDNSISEVQPWIKSTAGWWADGMISEDEFITAIEWMITNNIIQVAA